MLRIMWDRFLARYETASARYPYLSAASLVVIVTFFAIVIPIFLLAELKDMYAASTDLRGYMSRHGLWIYFSLFLIWLSIVVYLTVNMRDHLFLFISTLRLSNWCARRGCAEIAKSIVKKNRPITWSWVKYLERSTNDQKPQLEISSVAYDALVSSYLEGLGRIREGLPLKGSTQGTDPLLPSNFLLYARCVEQIREAVANRYKDSRKVRVAIRTLLTRDITWWYNIQRVHLPDDKALRCTTDWWEEYKEGGRDEKLKNQSIGLHRLLRFDPQANEADFEIQKTYFKLQIDIQLEPNRHHLTAREFREVKGEIAQKGLEGALQWLGGAELVEFTPRALEGDIHLHPICKITDAARTEEIKTWSSSTGRYVFRSAFEHYKEYHDTQTQCDETPTRHGAWCKEIRSDAIGEGEPWIGRYDDLFLMDFYDATDPSSLLGRFGISYRIEENKDIAGIRLLSSDELAEAVMQFDVVWRTAVAM